MPPFEAQATVPPNPSTQELKHELLHRSAHATTTPVAKASGHSPGLDVDFKDAAICGAQPGRPARDSHRNISPTPTASAPPAERLLAVRWANRQLCVCGQRPPTSECGMTRTPTPFDSDVPTVAARHQLVAIFPYPMPSKELRVLLAALRRADPRIQLGRQVAWPR